MNSLKVLLTYSLKNTFVLRDYNLLVSKGHTVLTLESPPYSDLIRFSFNRIKEVVLGFFYLRKADAVISWFNDYHSTAFIFWAKLMGKPSLLIIGGYDAISSPKLQYGIFLNKNLRSYLARWNYLNASEIWVVHQSLEQGCSIALKQQGTFSGIRYFLPQIKTNILEVPTAYNFNYWKKEGVKKEKTVLTVANIPDERTWVRKGVPLFIKLAEYLPDYKFTLAGIQNELLSKKILPQNIKLLGRCSAEVLKKEYSRHQFYFQGSLIEGLPNVLCEAMLCECIPLGNRVFGIPDAIGATGFVFNGAQDLKTVVEFIQGVTEDSDLGFYARKRIIENYPSQRRMQAFENFLNNV
jgi:hypothetical protein